MRRSIRTLLFCLTIVYALLTLPAAAQQDCHSGIPVCQNVYQQNQSYSGIGSVQEVSSTCLGIGETNSVWYIFKAQTSGSLAFTIVTALDYDFALYNVSSGGCGSVPSSTPIRCNYSGTSGSTGLTAAAQPETPAISVGAPGPPTMPGVLVTAGQTYALIVNNYSANQNGYTLTFTGTTAIFDNSADAGPDKAICCCGPQKLKIGSPALPGRTYQWTPSLGLDDPTSSSPIIDMSIFGDPSVPFPGTYVVTVTAASGCTATDSVYIKTVCSCRPPANVTVKRNNVCDTTYTLTANCACGDSAPSYLWMPGGQTTASIVVEAGSEPHTVTCRNECAATVSQPIVVPPATILSGGFPNITLPNVFTPNGDGVNDLWTVTDTTLGPGDWPAYNATAYEFLVFNRWGNQVAVLTGSTTTGFTNGSIPGWDGTANQLVLYSWWQHLWGRHDVHPGDALSNGTYYYIFRLKNCTTGWTDIGHGFIHLFR